MAKKNTESINYQEAMDELTSILNVIETGQIDLDELSIKIKRAADLIKFCKEKLKKVETEISSALDDLNEEESENEDLEIDNEIPFE